MTNLCGFWSSSSDMIRFKGTNDTICNSEEGTDSPRCDMAIEINKMSPLDTPKYLLNIYKILLMLRRGKVLNSHVFLTVAFLRV